MTISPDAARRDLLARLLALAAAGPVAARAATDTAAPRAPAEAPSTTDGPLWQAGRPTALAHEAAALLTQAADQGLVPADYGAAALARALHEAAASPLLAPDQAAGLVGRLLAALRQYLLDLHTGRIDGRAQFKLAGGPWPRSAWSPEPWLAPLRPPGTSSTPSTANAPGATIATGKVKAASTASTASTANTASTASPASSARQASVAGTARASGTGATPAPAGRPAPASPLAGLPAAAWPALPEYPGLQAALPPMRALIGHPAWATPLPPGPKPQRGQPSAGPSPTDGWAGWPVLAERLRLLGDLAEAAPSPGALADALRQFQHRHGLAVDGVPGPATRAALEVSPAARAEQLALTLERLRWRPQPAAGRWLEVNLPAFTLRLVERVDGRPQACGTVPVIVGQARGHATPQMLAEVQAIEFSPYWNVPPSIARQELVPQLRRDPGLADRLGYEAVLADGRLASAADPAVLAAVLAGRARLRQRPGERNALGGIKFVFPNADHIFLHHTPSVGLFERARRDFSHGCVRVQDPLTVALFLLRDQTDWPAERVRAAMASGESRTLRLARPVPILIGHETAFIGDDGLLHLRADLYGRDAALAEALRQRMHGRPGPA